MCTAEQMAFHIRTVGAEHCFLSTDRGQAECESPVEGMEKFLLTLLDHGITKKEIKTMTHDIPTEILNAV